MLAQKYFIGGIGTEIGKTIFASILLKAIQGIYWKPIQTGAQEDSDKQRVAYLSGLKKEDCWNEIYVFDKPCSPHQCFIEHNVAFDKNKLKIKNPLNRHLIVESAGGICSPIDQKNNMLDLFFLIGGRFILVVKNYLGSINHTMLCISLLRQRKVFIDYIVFMGKSEVFSENYIISHLNKRTKVIHIPYTPSVNPLWVSKQAEKIQSIYQ